MGIAKIQNLIQQFVHQHKVVLHGFFIEFPKVGLPQPDHAIYKLKHQRRVRVALRDGDQVYVLVLDMAEGGRAEGENGRAHLGVRDDLDAEDVGEARAAVVAEGAED